MLCVSYDMMYVSFWGALESGGYNFRQLKLRAITEPNELECPGSRVYVGSRVYRYVSFNRVM